MPRTYSSATSRALIAPQPNRMNSDLLTLIAARSSNDVLGVLSGTALWDTIAPQLQNQHFWYLRTAAAINLPLELAEWEGNEDEDWHQIYNILVLTRDRGNPFKSLDVLKRNGYNATAIKLLLELGYDLDPIRDGAILRDAAEIGNDVTVRLLLADGRMDPVWNITLGRFALAQAAEGGHLAVMHTLLDDPRVKAANMGIFRLALGGVGKTNQVKAAELLLDSREYSPDDVGVPFAAASAVGSLGVMELIWERIKPVPRGAVYSALVGSVIEGRVDSLEWLLERVSDVDYNDLADAAIARDQPGPLRVLMKYSGDLTPSYLLERVRRESVEVLKMILEDRSLTPAEIEAAIRHAVEQDLTSLLPILLADPRVQAPMSSLADLVNLNSIGTASILLEAKQTKLEDIPWEEVEYALNLIPESIGAITGAHALSGVDKREIERRVTHTCRGYNSCHYDWLLREIILRRPTLEQVMDWLIEKQADPTTSHDTDQLLTDVAAYVLSGRSPVGKSSEFEAYYGFLRFALDANREARKTLKQMRELGVSESGIEEAAILIGAFLGVERLRRVRR